MMVKVVVRDLETGPGLERVGWVAAEHERRKGNIQDSGILLGGASFSGGREGCWRSGSVADNVGESCYLSERDYEGGEKSKQIQKIRTISEKWRRPRQSAETRCQGRFSGRAPGGHGGSLMRGLQHSPKENGKNATNQEALD